MSEGARAALAVVSHERPTLRELAIGSALRSIELAGARVPVMVIDSSRQCAPTPPGVLLMHVPDQRTCVSKRRLAMEVAGEDWVILLDDDCQAGPAAVSMMLAAMGSPEHRDTGALFVVTDFAGPRSWMFTAAMRSDLTDGFGDPAAQAVTALDGDDVDWGVTTLSAFRRQAVLDVDAFRPADLTAPAGGEDVDACIRLRAAGWRLRRLPGVLARHDTGTWSTFRQNAKRSRNYGLADAELVRMHLGHSRVGYENLLVSSAFGAICARLVCRPVPPLWAVAGAGLAGWAAAEITELGARHREANAAQLLVQVAWSAAYESGRLSSAVARRSPSLAALRFNWEQAEPAGFSAALSPGTAARLATAGFTATGLAALAAFAARRVRGRR